MECFFFKVNPRVLPLEVNVFVLGVSILPFSTIFLLDLEQFYLGIFLFFILWYVEKKLSFCASNFKISNSVASVFMNNTHE